MIEMFDASAVKLMGRVARYSPEDRDFGMADFKMSRLYIQTHMAIKLSHVGLFPHHAYGLAHHDVSKAQQCHSALTTELLNNQTPHKMIAEFGTGSLGNEFCQWGIEELCNWQADDPPQKFEELKSKLGEFVLVKTSERWVERPHARTTKEIKRAPRHSILHINHVHSWSQIEKSIEDVKMFNELANTIDEVHPQVGQSGCATLAKLGLAGHPQIARLGHSGSIKEQAQIILHADAWTSVLFQTTCGFAPETMATTPAHHHSRNRCERNICQEDHYHASCQPHEEQPGRCRSTGLLFFAIPPGRSGTIRKYVCGEWWRIQVGI